ncbi:MAG: hypothetical protein ACOVP6_04735 [Lacibacter sp.]
MKAGFQPHKCYFKFPAAAHTALFKEFAKVDQKPVPAKRIEGFLPVPDGCFMANDPDRNRKTLTTTAHPPFSGGCKTDLPYFWT